MPRKQRQVGSVEQFVASRDLLPAALHHDAPGLALVGVVPVRLESDVASTAPASFVPSAVRKTTVPWSTT
jgi:hypothetical protein